VEQFETDLRNVVKDAAVFDINCGDYCREHLEKFEEAMRLFRKGAFASVDEFSRLASKAHPDFTQKMKALTALALGLHNPEDEYEQSDYYPFVQHLFRDDEVHSLKDSITVISYNYDCYLDYLLVRAHATRQTLGSPKGAEYATWRNRLTSGFDEPEDLGWASEGKGFHYYKLHGSVFRVKEKRLDFHKICFEDPAVAPRQARTRQDPPVPARLETLGTCCCKNNATPPIVFPWELFDGSGDFVSADDFVFRQEGGVRSSVEGDRLYYLYRQIWAGAKEAVMRATKVSFVGLSGHPYMDAGLKHLFCGKKGGVQVVVANKANSDFKDAANRIHPASPCGRMYETLRKVAPEMKCCRSSSENDGIFRADNPSSPEPSGITARYSFRDFIEKEMS